MATTALLTKWTLHQRKLNYLFCVR